MSPLDALIRPKPLSHYRQLTTGGRITVDLSQDEAAVALKAYDRGVHILAPEQAERLVAWIEAGGLDGNAPVAPPAKTFDSGEEALEHFIAECLADAPGESVKGGAISGAYTRYCHAHGVEPITSWPHISQRLRAAGYEQKRKAAGKFYLNCALVAA